MLKTLGAATIALAVGSISTFTPASAELSPADAKPVAGTRAALQGSNTSLCVTIPDASIGDVAVINITNTAAAGTGGYG
ncbi:hypothetical protein, partial [Ilumatobacter sp.]|uniref:hypothetical protein n=1 Tax=Ilumatobacter sp. TaxID=1967498 RepID=UPI002A31C320|nr:hypothetical protein [Ilumatobacter sp.]